MDLGIAGRKAIVGGASAGLGKACALSLAKEGVELTIVARTRENIEAAAEEIRKASGAKVTPLAADMMSDEGRAAVLALCPEPDILINNAGGPPTGNFRDWDEAAWISAVKGNMLGPIFMIKDTVDGMIARKFGRIVNITSSAVKAPIGILGLSNSARAGLTGFVAGAAREVAKHNVTINNVLPGDFDTDRHQSNTKAMAKVQNRTYEEMKTIRMAAVAAGRFGQPSELGDFCAYLCSRQAGFITAQNLLLDGGKYPGTF
ncbi:SDR family NAD(P)-dependent oxidoreductase [Shumkonia mesophila]|uniref:SDR family NAD(P)-dependent oxidoreductase n=1 Tax=Shumkonia mesophila TaxID=2838854 RepID=UPI002935179A|nr:SDR family NAD(P)-dependent oxidoreductase [Shumkonia mesophila]